MFNVNIPTYGLSKTLSGGQLVFSVTRVELQAEKEIVSLVVHPECPVVAAHSAALYTAVMVLCMC